MMTLYFWTFTGWLSANWTFGDHYSANCDDADEAYRFIQLAILMTIQPISHSIFLHWPRYDVFSRSSSSWSQSLWHSRASD